LGAQWNTISSALKLDNRIGKHAYIQPGLGISGGNLERDLEAIINLSKKNKLDTKLFTLYKKNSLDFKNWPFETYLKYFDKKNIIKIFILGLSYKKNTNSTKNSPSLILINKLKKYNKNLQINVYDPIIKNFKSSLFNLEKTLNLKNKYDIIFIMHDGDEFKNLSINKLDKILNKKNLVDPFGVFFRHKEKIKNYLSLC
jgi:UDPglucose 6-dehydrogenase